MERVNRSLHPGKIKYKSGRPAYVFYFTCYIPFDFCSHFLTFLFYRVFLCRRLHKTHFLKSMSTIAKIISRRLHARLSKRLEPKFVEDSQKTISNRSLFLFFYWVRFDLFRFFIPSRSSPIKSCRQPNRNRQRRLHRSLDRCKCRFLGMERLRGWPLRRGNPGHGE